MKKHLRRLTGLAAGLAASFGTAHAQSNVQLYGVMDLYVAKRQLASASGDSTTIVGSGGMTTSQWGFRGQEDLGGGLKAVFDVSGFIRADTGDTGRFPTPNFTSTIRLNPFGDSPPFNPIPLHPYVGGQPLDAAIASGGPAGVSDSAHNHTIAYTSPMLGGFSAALNVSASGSDDRRVGYSLTYGSGPLRSEE